MSPIETGGTAVTGAVSADEVSPDERAAFLEVARRSHAIITREQHPEGAYPAAPAFSAYAGYAWLRDGAFTAEGVSRYGDIRSADRFHGWVANVLAARREQVDRLLGANERGEALAPEQMLPTRFTFAGTDGLDPWWNFQTDGYGSWLWAVVTHGARHDLDLARWRAGIEVATDYITTFWRRPCYDWWEEHVDQRHVSTLAAMYGGLMHVAGSGLLNASREVRAFKASAQIRDLVAAQGVVDGHLTKWLGSSAIDGSLPACIVPFGLVASDDPVAARTLDAVADDLDVDGGVHRFRADVFYGGGQWLLLSALLGWNLAARGDRAGALRHLRWITAHATDEGELPEQVADHLLHPASRGEWVARWGDVASPLLWSHGMYLILADELGLTSRETGGAS